MSRAASFSLENGVGGCELLRLGVRIGVKIVPDADVRGAAMGAAQAGRRTSLLLLDSDPQRLADKSDS